MLLDEPAAALDPAAELFELQARAYRW